MKLLLTTVLLAGTFLLTTAALAGAETAYNPDAFGDTVESTPVAAPGASIAGGPSTFGYYHSSGSYYAQPKMRNRPMPRSLVTRYIQVAVTGLFRKVGSSYMNKIVSGNLGRIQCESSFRPGIIQQVVDVNTGANKARGLYQFTPRTFAHWRVRGYNDIYNPFDQVLAAINVQVNDVHRWMRTPHPCSGWGPMNAHRNPYA